MKLPKTKQDWREFYRGVMREIGSAPVVAVMMMWFGSFLLIESITLFVLQWMGVIR